MAPLTGPHKSTEYLKKKFKKNRSQAAFRAYNKLQVKEFVSESSSKAFRDVIIMPNLFRIIGTNIWLFLNRSICLRPMPL